MASWTTLTVGFNPEPAGPTKLWAEEAVRCQNELGESPVWCQQTNTLYWVDAPGQALWAWDLMHEPVKVDFHGETVGMVALCSDGRLLLGLSSSGMCAYDPRTGGGGAVDWFARNTFFFVFPLER